MAMMPAADCPGARSALSPPPMAVRIQPGFTTTAATPSGSSSAASARVAMLSAALADR